MVNMYLTPQERRVLEFVCNKNSDAKKAADFFCVSIHTMKQHLHNIYSKCGVENMAELVRMYHTQGLKEFYLKSKPIKMFDLFSGCGGFRLAAEQNSIQTIAYCEINKWAKKFYQQAFSTTSERFFEDATKIIVSDLPNFDLLCAGFPCQSFSIAGKRQGFNDTRGTMFFEVLRILKDKRPRYFILENVKGLLSHDNGQTFKTILKSLADLGFYAIEWSVLNSRFFSVPQNRERIFIVGYPRTYGAGKIFPLERTNGKNSIGNQKTNVIYWKNSKDKWVEEERQNVGALKAQSDLCSQPLIKAGVLRAFKENKGFREMADCVSPAITARAREDGDMQPVIVYDDYNSKLCINSPIGTLTKNCGIPSARNGFKIIKDFSVRRLTPLECFRLQGFTEDVFFKGSVGISDAQLYKLAGNSVTVPVVFEIMRALKKLHENL